MKLILRFCHSWGNINTFTLNVPEDITPEDLIDRIKEKVKITSGMIARLSRDGYMIRIRKGFSMEFFGIKEKTVIYIEKVENPEDKQKHNEERINFRYFEKLGLLNSISEEEEKEKPLDDQSYNSMTHDSLKISKTASSGSKNLSPTYGDESRLTKTQKSFEIKTYMEIQIEALLKETKNGNKEEIVSILETMTDIIPEQFVEEVRFRKKRLFDEVGSGGWNALHFAVFYGKVDICALFIERKADVNKKTNTDDGWSPLQLAIQKHHPEIVKMLLKCPSIDVNIRTPKGTALHLACKYNRTVIAMMILASPACDSSIKNSEGYLAGDLTDSPEIIAACEKNMKTHKKVEFLPEEEPIPESEGAVKPPIVTGFLFKIGKSNIRLNKRYFVLNADDGTFIRYQSKKEYPLKPLEIIALKDIIDIKFKKTAGFMLGEKYKFIEIKTKASTQTLACMYASTLRAWVKHLNDGRNYCLFIEGKLKDMKETKDDEGLFTLINRISITTKREYTITIEDQEKEEDRSMNWLSKANSNSNTPKSKQSSNNTVKVFNKIEYKRALSSEKLPPTTNPNPFLPTIVKRQTSTPLIPLDNEANDGNDSDIFLSTDNKERVSFKNFKIIKVLGSGAFGKVFMVKKKDNGHIFAMKALRKRTLLLKKQMKYAVSEANILKNSKHPFILSLHYCFQFLYMVLEYCSSGDLSLILAQQPDSRFDENIAKFYISELILAIEYLHSKNIIYRDLKPENILINGDGHIKLADFGLSKEGVGDGDRTKSFCGSPAYLSPEMVRNKGASKATDIYGIGTVLYEMVVGSPPFYDDDLKVMYRNIDEANLVFPNGLSPEVQDLIKKMMSKDPEMRIGVRDKTLIKSHPFFEGVDWKKVLDQEYEPPQLLEHEEENFEVDKGLGQFIDHDYDDFNLDVNRVKDFSFSEH